MISKSYNKTKFDQIIKSKFLYLNLSLDPLENNIFILVLVDFVILSNTSSKFSIYIMKIEANNVSSSVSLKKSLLPNLIFNFFTQYYTMWNFDHIYRKLSTIYLPLVLKAVHIRINHTFGRYPYYLHYRSRFYFLKFFFSNNTKANHLKLQNKVITT